MSVEAQLDSPRRIAAHFQKQRPEVHVVDVEVVMVDVNRLVAVELKLSVDLCAVERFRLLLRHTNEDDLVPHPAPPPKVVGDIVLAFLVIELINRNLLPLRLSLHRFAELLRHLAQHHRRRNRFSQLHSHERHQATRCRQSAHVSIQVQPVQALNFQGDVSV